MEELILDIVNALVSENCSLETAMLKTKVLAYKIKNDRLINWVNSELDGYPSDDRVPDYRVFVGRVIGQMSNGFQRITNTSIPIYHLKEETIRQLTQFHFRDGIGSLEYMLKQADNALSINFPPEMCAIINNKIKSDFKVEFAHKEIPGRSVKDILSTVKSKLLEFLLELESEFEIKLNISEMKKDKEKVNDLINTTIYGNNNVIISGDNNKQHVTYKIKTNDLKDLTDHLSKMGIEQADVNELAEIVIQEKPDFERKQFGPQVKTWIKKLTGKAIDGVWQVSLSSAGQILGDAISQYYGI